MADPVSLSINALLIATNVAMQASQSFEGPRLEDLNVNTADYGVALNYFRGQSKFNGLTCFWTEPLHEVKERHKTKGGKYNEYTYFWTGAVAIADHEIGDVLKVWFDRHLVYDATAPSRVPTTPFEVLALGLEQKSSLAVNRFMRIYKGTADQLPDPRMSATVDAEFGEGSTPAYRGLAYLMFEEVPLEKFGNRVPQISVLAATVAADIFPYEVIETDIGKPYQPSLDSVCFAPDYSRYYFTDQSGGYQIVDLTARQTMISGAFPEAAGGSISGVDRNGFWYLPLFSGGVGKFGPDGTILHDTLAGAYTAQGCQVFSYSDGSDYLCIYPALTSFRILAQRLDFPDTIVEINTSTNLGDDWTPTAYVSVGSDGDETLWAVGVLQGVFEDPTEVFFLKIANSGDLVSAGTYEKVTGLPGLGSMASVDCCWSPSGHFILHAGGVLYKIDIAAGFTIVDSAPIPYSTSAETPTAFRTLAPGSTSIWLGPFEVDLETLETLREITPGDWGHGSWSGGKIYDPRNHAILSTGGILAADELFWNFLDRKSGDGVTLRSIVEYVSESCGLDPDEDIDATDLTQAVRGYSWTQGTPKQILEPLLEAYDSEARPHDFKIQFLRRGVAVGGSIPVAQMGAAGSTRYEIPALGDTDLPLKVSLTYADFDADHQANTAYGQRPGAVTDSRRELALSLSTLVLTADEARQMAEGYERRLWMKGQTPKLSLTRGYIMLEPADARTLVFDDVQRTAKVTKLEFGANGVLTTNWERYNPAIHTATSLPGATGDGLTPSVLPVFGYTKGVALDVPLARDSDEATLPLLYLAAAPYSDTPWPGALFLKSADGLTYDEELGSVASSERAAIGHMLSALPDALATVWDEASVVSVKMFSGTLTSATSAEVKNGANRAAIRSGDGWEIVGFRTATLVAEKTYQLAGFLRGRRGTDQALAGHATGDEFVLLNGVPKTTQGADQIATTFYVKPVTQGGFAGFPQAIDPYVGASKKPYSVVHLAVADVGGDWVATWRRRTRIGGAWRNFQGISLGEGSEGYVAEVLDAGGAVIRTFAGLTSPTVTYTAAQQATDGGLGVTLRVKQTGSTVNGYARDVELA